VCVEGHLVVAVQPHEEALRECRLGETAPGVPPRLQKHHQARSIGKQVGVATKLRGAESEVDQPSMRQGQTFTVDECNTASDQQL